MGRFWIIWWILDGGFSEAEKWLKLGNFDRFWVKYNEIWRQFFGVFSLVLDIWKLKRGRNGKILMKFDGFWAKFDKTLWKFGGFLNLKNCWNGANLINLRRYLVKFHVFFVQGSPCYWVLDIWLKPGNWLKWKDFNDIWWVLGDFNEFLADSPWFWIFDRNWEGAKNG